MSLRGFFYTMKTLHTIATCSNWMRFCVPKIGYFAANIGDEIKGFFDFGAFYRQST